MVWRTARLMVKAVRNLLRDMLSAPAARTKGRERHGRRKDGGQRDGEDGVVLHPVADAFEDARGDALFEEGHASGLADLVAEVSAEGRAGGGEQDEEEPRCRAGAAMTMIMMSVMPGMGSGTKERVDDGDEEDAEDAEAEEEVEEGMGVAGAATMREGEPMGAMAAVAHRRLEAAAKSFISDYDAGTGAGSRRMLRE